jgi:hypothetical protein
MSEPTEEEFGKILVRFSTEFITEVYETARLVKIQIGNFETLGVQDDVRDDIQKLKTSADSLCASMRNKASVRMVFFPNLRESY